MYCIAHELNIYIKMQNKILMSITLTLIAFIAFAQDYRTITGINNNLSNPDWGSAFSPLIRATDIAYADGISSPGGIDRPNPRVISNDLFSQSGLLDESRQLSSYIWGWGQFIDHDIDLTEDDPELAMIDVPAGDPWFDSNNTGNVKIPMKRSEFIANTGTDISNPRQHPNRISSFIDGSAVYGSDQHTADWLRDYEQGKLKVSKDNLLPFNTLNGELTNNLD